MVNVVGSGGVDVNRIVGHASRNGGYRMRVNGCNTDVKKHTQEP